MQIPNKGRRIKKIQKQRQKTQLEPLPDTDMLLMIEKSIGGGMLFINI